MFLLSDVKSKCEIDFHNLLFNCVYFLESNGIRMVVFYSCSECNDCILGNTMKLMQLILIDLIIYANLYTIYTCSILNIYHMNK